MEQSHGALTAPSNINDVEFILNITSDGDIKQYISSVWTIKALLLQRKETLKCTSNMKPVGGEAISCLTAWFHGHQEAASFVIIISHHDTIKHSFIPYRQASPGRVPSQTSFFLFQWNTLFGSSEQKWDFYMWEHEAWTFSTTWRGLCWNNPEFGNTKWTDSDRFHIASFHL